ncbi:MAG: hypothetical protein ABSH06_30310 [Thermodesulfobacteriota bacterium]|jgi:hypothetical protein
METSTGIIDHYLKGCIDRRKILIITLSGRRGAFVYFQDEGIFGESIKVKKGIPNGEVQMSNF